MYTAHARVLFGSLISATCVAVVGLRHGPASPGQRDDGGEARLGHRDVMIVTPHKTGSSFLSQVFQEVASQLHTCHLTQDNCMNLWNQSSCRGAVVGPLHVDQGSWGSECGPVLLGSFTGGPNGTGLDFDGTPYIYAPIRNWSYMPTLYKHRGVLKILHHRHPLDTLCSAYRSFGWNHKKPPEKSSEEFLSIQQDIQNMTVDDYAIAHVYRQIWYIKDACRAVQDFNRQRDGSAVFSSYEGMVTDFSAWMLGIAEVMLPNSTEGQRVSFVSRVIDRVRPDFRNDGQHKNHTQPNRYLEELRPETVQRLRDTIRRHVPNVCVCWTMNYHDICSTEAQVGNTTSMVASSRDAGALPESPIDPMLMEWGVDDS